MHAKVCELIVYGKWEIDDSLKRTAPEIMKPVEDTKIAGRDDEIIWTVSKYGEFKLKDTYEELRKKNPTYYLVQIRMV